MTGVWNALAYFLCLRFLVGEGVCGERVIAKERVMRWTL